MVALFETIIDDTLDKTYEYQLLNEVKDELEENDDWEILRAEDSTQMANVGDTFQTFHALPADFARPSEEIFVGTDRVPYLQIPFRRRRLWQDVTHRFYLDMKNSQYALCGMVSVAGTIYFNYFTTSGNLAQGGTANWPFPARFHPLLPYLMAIKYYAVDQGDKYRSWDDRWDIFAKTKLESMRRWNMRLKKEAEANDNLTIDLSSHSNIIDIDGAGGPSLYGQQ